jgi:hypothetical protein
MKYFRNTEEIRGQDTFSLWVLADAEESGFGEPVFVLVDDDEHVVVQYESNKDYFIEVEAPD